MTGPGDLSRRLVLQEPLETPDESGGVIRSYHDVATLWAQVVPLTTRWEVEAEAAGATVTHRILIRSGPLLSTRHRLRDGAREFDILGWRETDVTRRYLDIQARQRAG